MSFLYRPSALLLSLSLCFSNAWAEGKTLEIDTLGKKATTTAPKAESKNNIINNIDIDGLLIVEAWNAFGAQTSDLLIDTAQMTFSGRLTNDISATVEWLYEEPAGDLELNLAKMEWNHIQNSNFSLIAGKDLLPFGFDGSEMLTDPLPYALGELYKTALGIHYDFPMGQVGVTVFKGEADTKNQNINNFILSLSLEPCKGFSTKINYLSDLQEAGYFEGSIQNNIPYESLSALNVQSQIFLGYLTLSLDFVRGLEESKNGLISQFLPQAIPLAWSTEASLGLNEMTTLALTLEGSEELPSDPELRFGILLKRTLHQNLSLGFELLRSEYEIQNDETLATAHLEVSF